MDRPNTIQLPIETKVKPSKWAIQAMPGVVAVEMLPQRERVGSIILTDTGKNQLQADAGYVIASGDDGYSVGELVLVLPENGTWFENFLGHEGKRVRLYGISSPNPYTVLKEGAKMSIPAKVDGTIQAKKDWLFIRRDPAPDGFIKTLDADRPGTATIISAGETSGHEAGQRVVYHDAGIIYDLEFLDRYPEIVGNHDPKDFCFIHKNNIYCEVAA